MFSVNNICRRAAVPAQQFTGGCAACYTIVSHQRGICQRCIHDTHRKKNGTLIAVFIRQIAITDENSETAAAK